MLSQCWAPSCMYSSTGVQLSRGTSHPQRPCVQRGTAAFGSTFSVISRLFRTSGSHLQVLSPWSTAVQVLPAVCRVHSSAHAPPSGDLMDDFDRESARSLPRRAIPRSVQAGKHGQGLQPPSGQAPAAAKVGPEQLEQVLGHLQHLAGSSASSPDAGQLASARAILIDACKPQDRWQLLYCGEWAAHTNGWSSPAHALIQVWPVAAPTGVADEVVLEYDIWEVAQTCLPSGEKFESGTGFEKLTSKARDKKFANSCRLKATPFSSDTGLRTWLASEFGRIYKLQSKSKASGDKRRKHGSSRKDGSSSRAAKQHRRPKAAHMFSIDNYAGVGELQPGPAAQAALAAAASAAAGPAPTYILPEQAPVARAPEFCLSVMHANRAASHHKLLKSIEAGTTHLAQTHTPLHKLLECHSELAGLGVSSSSISSSSSARAAGLQVYDLLELKCGHAAQQGADNQLLAVVPDSTRPFTITLHNNADGLDYVLAHYEPRGVAWGITDKAAILCEAYASMPLIDRACAPRNEQMAMGGMRVGRVASAENFGRYSGDHGPEADQFSLLCWPELATTGGFRALSDLWCRALPGLVCKEHRAAAREVSEGTSQPRGFTSSRGKGRPGNYPAPALLGGPFTTLAVTQNYLSHLHCEPEEHPYSFIVWADVLSSGSSMEVGYFWLTNGLAYTPKHGSALYIDVRLVPHCSDPCTVHNARSELEGRYGAALFIKPPVYAMSTRLWATFDQFNLESSSSSKAQGSSSSSSGVQAVDSSSSEVQAGDSSSSSEVQAGDSSSSSEVQAGDSSSSSEVQAGDSSSSSEVQAGDSSSSSEVQAGDSSSSSEVQAGDSSSSSEVQAGDSSSSSSEV